MISSLLVACVLAANPEATPSTAPPDLAAYKQAKASVGRDAEAHVRLALWCEAHGLNAERTKHLTIATLIDPAHATARGLLGMVQYKGKWLSPDAVAEKIQADPEQQARIHEYLERRVKATDKPDDQMKLAAWCAQNELKDQATAHYYRAVQLDPGRELAWKYLGYQKSKGGWAKPEQLAAAKEMAELQTKANKHWKPILEKLRVGLASHSAAEREKSQTALNAIKDPAAVTAIWVVLAQRDTKRQELAVKLFSQIDAPDASKALAMLAIVGRSADVRRHSVEILKVRDPRDFVEVLVAMIRKPIQYEIRKPAGLNTPGELFVKGTNKNIRRLYKPNEMPNFRPQSSDTFRYDSNGLPVVSRVVDRYSGLLAIGLPLNSIHGPISYFEAQRAFNSMGLTPSPAQTSSMWGSSFDSLSWGSSGISPSALVHAGIPANVAGALAKTSTGHSMRGLMPTAELMPVALARLYGTVEERYNIPLGQMVRNGLISAQQAEQRLQSDVQQIEAYNTPIRDINRKSRQVLADTVGTDLGDDPDAWDRWTTDLFGRLVPVSLSKSSEVPTVTEEVTPEYLPQAIPTVVEEVSNAYFVRTVSCFAGGTPVRTIDGPRPIESILPGDLVLTQDTTTGSVTFNPVLNIFHNPPKETFKISLEGSEDTIVPTAIHRFWKAGQGWVMARDLKPGDVLRTSGGSVTVRSVEPDKTQPVYNLRVASAADYFVGELGVLSHDNSLPMPVDKPFDRVNKPDKIADRH